MVLRAPCKEKSCVLIDLDQGGRRAVKTGEAVGSSAEPMFSVGMLAAVQFRVSLATQLLFDFYGYG